MPHKRD